MDILTAIALHLAKLNDFIKKRLGKNLGPVDLKTQSVKTLNVKFQTYTYSQLNSYFC